MKTLVICLVAMFVCVASALGGDIQYTITDLAYLSGSYGACRSSANAINNSGQVVGSAQVQSTGGADHAFLYSNGTMQDLGTLVPGNNASRAYGISSNGKVVGFSDASVNWDAFLYSNGAMSDLGAMGGYGSYGYGINDSGQVAGIAFTDTGVSAFLYANGTRHDLGTLGGNTASARGINSSGQVAGFSRINGTIQHAFLYSNGVMNDLGTMGGDQSWAYEINNNGQLVGSSQVSDGSLHPFLYSNGVMLNLGGFGGDSEGQGINNLGQIVGYTRYLGEDATQNHAFLYSDGALQDLNNLIDPSLGWTLNMANGINDSGQIVGYGTNASGWQHGFLLTPTPTPEPSTIVLLISGLTAGGLLRLRRKKIAG